MSDDPSSYRGRRSQDGFLYGVHLACESCGRHCQSICIGCDAPVCGRHRKKLNEDMRRYLRGMYVCRRCRRKIQIRRERSSLAASIARKRSLGVSDRPFVPDLGVLLFQIAKGEVEEPGWLTFTNLKGRDLLDCKIILDVSFADG
jgi:hypothetical protein